MQYFFTKFEEDKSQYLADTHSDSVRAEVIMEIPPAKEFRITIARLKPGAAAHPHSHEWEHAMYIMKGKGRFVIEGQEAILSEGMLGFAPQNAIHSVENIGKEELVVFGVSGPAKTEIGYAQLKRSEKKRGA